jgi:hypothetical protein
VGIFPGAVETTSVSRLLDYLICCSWKEVHNLNACSCKFANFFDFSREIEIRKEKARRSKGQQAIREGKIKIRKKSGRRAELKTNMEKAFQL